MEENFEKRVETQKKIPNIVVSKFLHKSGTDALRKHICTQCVLKRNTSEGEMPRAHTGAAFFSLWQLGQAAGLPAGLPAAGTGCRRVFHLVVFERFCRRSFPLSLLFSQLAPLLPSGCLFFSRLVPSFFFLLFFLGGGNSRSFKYSTSAGLPAAGSVSSAAEATVAASKSDAAASSAFSADAAGGIAASSAF